MPCQELPGCGKPVDSHGTIDQTITTRRLRRSSASRDDVLLVAEQLTRPEHAFCYHLEAATLKPLGGALMNMVIQALRFLLGRSLSHTPRTQRFLLGRFFSDSFKAERLRGSESLICSS